MRIQVNLSDEMVTDVDALAKRYGVTRSGLCAMLIGQGVSGHNEAWALMKNKDTIAELSKYLDEKERSMS